MSASMRLLLLRHGQTEANVMGALDTAHPGTGLTTLGHAQASAAARVLVEPIEGIYVSSRIRAHQTAAPLAARRGITPVTIEGLEEVSAGSHEMTTDHEGVSAYLHTVGAWLEGNDDVRMPGGESGREFHARYDAAIRQVAEADHDCALVVSHGAAIRLWASRQIGASAVAQAHTRFHNTGCVTLTGHPDTGWALQSWHADPVGGPALEDENAPDPTGEPDPD